MVCILRASSANGGIFFLRLRIALFPWSKFTLMSPERSRSRSDPSHLAIRHRLVARPNATATGAVDESPDSHGVYVDFGSRMRRKVGANSLLLKHFEHDCTRLTLVFGTARDVMSRLLAETPAREAYTPFRDVQVNPRDCRNPKPRRLIAAHARRTRRVAVSPWLRIARAATRDDWSIIPCWLPQYAHWWASTSQPLRSREASAHWLTSRGRRGRSSTACRSGGG